MRVFQIETFYPPFLNGMYADGTLAERPYDEQIEILMRSGFSAGHMMTPYLPELGHEAFTCIGNCPPLQKRWLAENGGPRNNATQLTLHDVILQQIETFKPDVFYATDPTFFDSRQIERLSVRPKLCVGWRAAPTPPSVDFSAYDLMLTSDERFRDICIACGAKTVEYHYPGHPLWINEALGPQEHIYDIVFSGQVGPLHEKRTRFLESIIPALTANGVTVGLFALGNFPRNLSLNMMNKGPVFGLDMYRTLAQSRMTLNIVIDTASQSGINMRHFEATGMGSLAVDAGTSRNAIFENGRESFCFETIGQSIDGILDLLKTPERIEAVAAAGHKKCVEQYEMTVRTRHIIDTCERYLNR